MAGIRGANDLARCLPYSVLDAVHRAYYPRVITRSWVDDVIQRAGWTAATALRDLSAAGKLFAGSVRAEPLVVSSTTACISTDVGTSCAWAASLMA